MMAIAWLLVLLIAAGGAAAFFIGVLAALWAGGPSAPERGEAALRIAAERYARGEIDRDQYRQLKRDLSA
jgi:uncharacterized membrane protein